jgi:hypothetical protein
MRWIGARSWYAPVAESAVRRCLGTLEVHAALEQLGERRFDLRALACAVIGQRDPQRWVLV